MGHVNEKQEMERGDSALGSVKQRSRTPRWRRKRIRFSRAELFHWLRLGRWCGSLGSYRRGWQTRIGKLHGIEVASSGRPLIPPCSRENAARVNGVDKMDYQRRLFSGAGHSPRRGMRVPARTGSAGAGWVSAAGSTPLAGCLPPPIAGSCLPPTPSHQSLSSSEVSNG